MCALPAPHEETRLSADKDAGATYTVTQQTAEISTVDTTDWDHLNHGGGVA